MISRHCCGSCYVILKFELIVRFLQFAQTEMQIKCSHAKIVGILYYLYSLRANLVTACLIEKADVISIFPFLLEASKL